MGPTNSTNSTNGYRTLNSATLNSGKTVITSYISLIIWKEEKTACTCYNARHCRLCIKKTKAMSLRSQLWQTAKTAFDRYGEMTPESVIACRSPECIHRLYPASAGIPDRTNKEYSDFVMGLKSVVPNLRLIIQDDLEPIIDESARTVATHVKSAGDTEFGPCEAEYLMVLKMNDTGTEIIEFVEFIDTAYTMDFIKRAKLEV